MQRHLIPCVCVQAAVQEIVAGMNSSSAAKWSNAEQCSSCLVHLVCPVVSAPTVLNALILDLRKPSIPETCTKQSEEANLLSEMHTEVPDLWQFMHQLCPRPRKTKVGIDSETVSHDDGSDHAFHYEV